ncbi:MAG: MIP/aquaporin family protein [Chitinophagaceae bacterium]
MTVTIKKYLVEFIGTFFLVLSVCMAGTKAGDFAPIAIGSTLMVMVYAGGYISGGYYNPAISLAAFIRGRIPVITLIAHWIVQLLAAIVAAYVAKNLFLYQAHLFMPDFPKRAIIAEGLGTFALAYVVLNVATSAKTAGNSNYGLAIGFTVTAMAYVLGPFSGGAFNTAVALGACVFGAFAWSNLWIYIIGTIGGGLVAGLVYKWMNPDAMGTL